MSDILYSLDLKDIPEMFMKYNKNVNIKNFYNKDIYANFDLLFIILILFIFYDNDKYLNKSIKQEN